MSTKEQTTKLPEIYNSEEFLAKYRQVTQAPTDTIQHVAQFLMRIYDAQSAWPTDVKEDDPLNLLRHIENAENGDPNSITIIIGSFNDISGSGENSPSAVAAFEYWGNKAMTLRICKACFRLAPYYAAKGDSSSALTAARYSIGITDDENLRNAAQLFFVSLVASLPNTYEDRAYKFGSTASTSEVRAMLAEAKEKKDPVIYLFCTTLLIERNQPIEKETLKEICYAEKIPHVYFLLTSEKATDVPDDFDSVVAEIGMLNSLSKFCINNAQQEYYIRIRFEFCRKYFDENISLIASDVFNLMQDREDYDSKTGDLLVALHATIASAQKLGIAELEENAKTAYQQLFPMAILNGYSIDDIPALDNPVNPERLKRAFYYDIAATQKRATLGTILEPRTSGSLQNAHTRQLQGTLTLEKGKKKNGVYVYQTSVSFPCKKNDACTTKPKFYDSEIHGMSNMVRGGLVSSLSSNWTTIDATSKLDAEGVVYDVDWTFVVDLSYNTAEKIEDVELYGDGIFDDDYYTLNLTVVFLRRNAVYNPTAFSDDSENSNAESKKTQKSAPAERKEKQPAQKPKQAQENQKSSVSQSTVNELLGLLNQLNDLTAQVEALNERAAQVVADENDPPKAEPKDSWTYSKNYGGCTISEYTGDGVNIVVPSTIDCVRVEEVGNNRRVYGGFLKNSAKKVRSITLSPGIKRLVNNAFYGCGKVKEIILPEGLEQIGERAFDSCKSLESITIPSTVKQIGSEAFLDCKSLTQVIVSNTSAMEIPLSAFKGCINLIGEDGMAFVGSVLVNYNGDAAEVTVPPKATAIGVGAFSGKNVTKIILPEGLKEIGEHAFENCKSLKMIIIPSSIKKIGSWAFKDCESLEGVVLPEGLEQVGEFWGCKSLKTIKLPAAVKKINRDAFYRCESLQEIVLPEGVEIIDDCAFEYCKSLREITIPASVKTMGCKVFSGGYNSTVYCRSKTKPLGWDDNWDVSYRYYGDSSPSRINVVWGYAQNKAAAGLGKDVGPKKDGNSAMQSDSVATQKQPQGTTIDKNNGTASTSNDTKAKKPGLFQRIQQWFRKK